MEKINIYSFLDQITAKIDYYLEINEMKIYHEYCYEKESAKGNKKFIKIPRISSKQYQKIKEDFFKKEIPENIKKKFNSYLKDYHNEYHAAFHNFVIDYDYEDAWYNYEEQELIKEAISFCTINNIEYIVDRDNVDFNIFIMPNFEDKEFVEYFNKKFKFD